MLKRAFPIGAEIHKNRVHFRVWAPICKEVDVVLQDGHILPLKRERGGYFSSSANIGKGSLYQFCLDGRKKLYSDPASRFQPAGPDAPSQVIDPTFNWSDKKWGGVVEKNNIFYCMHVGTFTPAGTFSSAQEKLPSLKEMGVTLIEMMPIAEFPGRFSWGYDGVNLFAPSHNYGTPDDLKRFINEAHRLGIGVILDIPYPKLESEKHHLNEFALDYSDLSFFVTNAKYWTYEYHVDGFHFLEGTPKPLISKIRETLKNSLIIDDDFTTLSFNEDFHRATSVRVTKRQEAYMKDYTGKPQEFLSLAKHGFLYQGQWSHWEKEKKGTPLLDLPPHKLIHFLEHPSEIAHFDHGIRVREHCTPAFHRALVAYFLLSPQTPLLFQGEEWGAKSPFCYFTDSDDAEKRSEKNPSPCKWETFCRSKLNWEKQNQALIALYKDLIILRKHDPVFSHPTHVDGAVLGDDAFFLRFFAKNEERLLFVNFGQDHLLNPAPLPLLAPPSNTSWHLLWLSEEKKYGGKGSFHLPKKGEWTLPAQSSLVLGTKSA